MHGRGLADELVQLVILIVYTLVLDSFKYQIAQSIVGIIGEFFGDLAGDHAVQFVVGVDMGALIGLVRLLAVLIICSGIFGVIRLVNLIATVQTRCHIADGVHDVSITIFGLSRRNLTVSVAVTFNGGIFFAGLRFGGFVRSGLIIASSENARNRPAAGLPEWGTGGWPIKRKLLIRYCEVQR